ncbi:MAG TPA: hypothetical protein VK540_07320 [Polyangiaceae bacterium]|jgi:hypothetical protein|nr:hypothetical protein [Polyangiaceae bacterium]
MSKRSLGGFLLWVVACVACNGDSTTAGTPTDPFVGNWACSEQMSLSFTSPPGMADQKQTEMSTLSITAAGGVLTASKNTDAGPSCKVSFTSNGSTATLSEGQTCTTRQGVSLSYKSGSATVSGSSMESSFSFDASGTFNVGGMMVPAMATGTQTSTCSRLSPPPGGGATTGGW